ncbi:MAG: hypothetical protein V1652_03275 [bacterium]
MSKRGGFITLMSVIIMVAVAASLAISVILMGVDSLRTGQSIEAANEATAIADACAEESLEQIRVYNFIGTQNLTIGSGTCSYTITNDGGENRTIEISAVALSVTRRVRIITDVITPEIHIATWQDVTSF